MDLNILTLFIKEGNYNESDFIDLNHNELKFVLFNDNTTNTIGLNGIMYYYNMYYLNEKKYLNLPIIIFNLLVNPSIQQKKLALNLLKTLDPNKKYQ